MNNNNKEMKAENYFNQTQTPKAVWLRVDLIRDDNDDVINKNTSHLDLSFKEIFTEAKQQQLQERNHSKKTYKGDDCNMLGVDTSKYIKLDLDIHNQQEFDELPQETKDFIGYLDKNFPYHMSVSKPLGKHYILADITEEHDDKLIKAFQKYLKKFKKSKLSDYDKYKQSNDKYMYMSKGMGCIEVLTGQWGFVLPDATIHNTHKKLTLNRLFTKKILPRLFNKSFCDKMTGKKKLIQVVNEPIEMSLPQEPVIIQAENDEMKCYIKNISMRYIDAPMDFYKIVMAVGNKKLGNKYKELIKKVGSQSSKAKENYSEWFEKLYEKAKYKNFGDFIIKTYSKESNSAKHYKIYSRFNNKTITTYTSKHFSDVFVEQNRDSLLVQRNTDFPDQPTSVYLYNTFGEVWVNETMNKFKVLKCFVGDDIQKYIEAEMCEIHEKIETTQDENLKDSLTDKYNELAKQKAGIQEPHLRNNIATIMEQEIMCRNASNYEFDKKIHLLAFADMVYDLKDNCPKPISKTDYIMRKINYELREPDPDNYKEFILFYNSLMKSKAVLADLTYILATALIGITPQHLFMLNGEGSNGKSVIQNLLSKALTDIYISEASGTLLCEKLNPAKASPEWATLHKKRAAIFSEPNEKELLNPATIKSLSGDKKINARLCYSNKCGCDIEATLIMICNERPLIDGKINHAIARRFVDILFPHNFTNDPHKISADPDKYKQGNKMYEDDTWLDEAKYSLLQYLLTFINNYPKDYGDGMNIIEHKYVFSDETLERTRHYLASCDKLQEWIDTAIKPQEGSWVKLKDLHMTFKGSDVYQALPHKEQQQQTFKVFLAHILKQPQFTQAFIKGPQHIPNDGSHRNVLKGWYMLDTDEIEEQQQEQLGLSNHNSSDESDDYDDLDN
tara:strand:- start:4148 stop:6847 length:2700 start_codon:yes stop_codon:yes gene_type:complete